MLQIFTIFFTKLDNDNNKDTHDAIDGFCNHFKVFHCVHQDTQVRKLRHYGLAGRNLDLLKSYVINSIRRAKVNGTRSPWSLISLGAPQGTILAPFLFFVCIRH